MLAGPPSKRQQVTVSSMFAMNVSSRILNVRQLGPAGVLDLALGIL